MVDVRIFASTIVAALLITACTAPAPATPVQDSAKRVVTAPTSIPANVSHGEAAIGSDVDHAPVDASAPPRSDARVVHVRFEILDTIVTVSNTVRYKAWTFAGRIPGPVVRVTQGDSVEFTLVNHASMPHSMDFHAAQIAPDKYYVNINSKDSIHYSFRADVAGVFMYHCGTSPVAAHIANGMYGALIVDPKTPRAKAKEIFLVQSEFYMTPDSGGAPRSLAWDRLLSLSPDIVAFNGRASQYATHPIAVKVNELVRIYLVNAGPNRVSSFHVVGGIFERVFLDGASSSSLSGVQTVAVPVGGGSVFEIRLKEPGDYPFVTHAFADATKGAVGVFKAVP